jgi:hypothetical protein
MKKILRQGGEKIHEKEEVCTKRRQKIYEKEEKDPGKERRKKIPEKEGERSTKRRERSTKRRGEKDPRYPMRSHELDSPFETLGLYVKEDRPFELLVVSFQIHLNKLHPRVVQRILAVYLLPALQLELQELRLEGIRERKRSRLPGRKTLRLRRPALPVKNIHVGDVLQGILEMGELVVLLFDPLEVEHVHQLGDELLLELDFHFVEDHEVHREPSFLLGFRSLALRARLFFGGFVNVQGEISI